MTELFVDFGREAGRIKPLHGFNNCARNTEYGEILPDFLALRPPIVRLHDTVYPYGGGHYVDVNNIFCDFSADPDDETAYDFPLTDLYIKPLADAGIGIFAVSTFNTDYVMVKEKDLERAVDTLKENGYEVV